MFDVLSEAASPAMSDFDAVFNAVDNVTLQTLLKFALLIVPGFIAYRAGERIGGRGRTKVSDHIIDIVIYSLLCDIVMLSLVTLVAPIGNGSFRTVCIVLAMLLGGGALPVALAFGWNRFSKYLVSRRLIPDLTEKPWDHIFRRIVDEEKNLGVLVTLRDGRRVGARLHDPGYTSSYPATEQMMLGPAWRVNELGEFIKPVEGSWGLLIDKADCEMIEFLEWDVVERRLTHLSNGEVNHERQVS